MKKRIISLILVCLLLCGCGKEKEIENKNITVSDVSDYIVSVPTYTKINDEETRSNVNKLIDGWNNETDKSIINESGCTAFAKVIDGETIVARNMDLNITNAPEYIFYINEEGKNKSFNVSNVSQISESYENVLKDGISSDLYNMLPYLITDTINEYGLVLEVNMRNDEYDYSTKELLFKEESTNPNANIRVSVHGAMRYLSDYAKNVNEALSMLGAINANTNEKYGDGVLDIYSLYTEDMKWNYGVLIADAEGNYGVLDFVDNKVLYYPNQKYQANYYIGGIYKEKEKLPQGLARTSYIESKYNSINNIYDMMSVINDINYSNVYSNNAKFDVTSEYTGLDIFSIIEDLENHKTEYGYTLEDYSNLKQTFYDTDTSSYVVLTKDNYKEYPNRVNIWTTEYVLNNNKNNEVKEFIKWYSNFYNSLTKSQIRNISTFWNTAHSITYNATQKYAIVTFYEDKSTTRVYTFDNIK